MACCGEDQSKCQEKGEAAVNPARTSCCGKGWCREGKQCDKRKCCKSLLKWGLAFVLSAIVGVVANKAIDMVAASCLPSINEMYAAAPAGMFRVPASSYPSLWHPVALAFLVSLLSCCGLCPCRTVLFFALFSAPFAGFVHAMFNVRAKLVFFWIAHLLITVFLEALPFCVIHGRRCCHRRCCRGAPKPAATATATAADDADKGKAKAQ